ncbi:MAG: nucleotidyltransferase domain-containing protein, partial [Akkermansiaceae bacterium]
MRTLLLSLLKEDEELSSLALVASGGYGRGIMNPGSDVDLLFLTSVPSSKVSKRVSEIICELQNTVWDLGFKFLPSTRSITECLNEARLEPQSRTALFNARLIIGPQELFQKFQDHIRINRIAFR